MLFESILLNITILVVLIVALIFDYVTKFFSYWYVRHVPYKRPIPFYGSDYHRVLGIRNTTEEIKALYTDYPEKFVGAIKSRIPDLVVKDPDAIKKTLSTDFSNFHSRGTGLDKSRDVCLRNNLFYAEGEKWTLLRRRLDSLLSNMDFLEDSLHDCLSGTNGDANVQQLLSEILDVVFKDLLFDNNSGGSVITNMRQTVQNRSLFEKLKSYLKNVFPSVYVLLGMNTMFQFSDKSIEIVKESKLMKEIKKIEASAELELNEKNKKFGWNDVDFASAHLSLFITEGYVPCLFVLTSLLYELSKQPQVQQSARNCVSKSNDDDYLDLIIKETLRLHPPFSVITRKCVKAYQLSEKEFLVDKGVTISVPVEAIQSDECNFKDAQSFNPDRFLDADKTTSAYMPFGMGPRKCIGEKLALRIVRSVAAHVLRKYEVEPSVNTPNVLPVTDHNFGRVIDQDIWLRFKPIGAQS